jgi:hypothetical protein
LLAFAADAGSLAALGGQDVGVAGVSVAPAQVILEFPGQHGVAGVIRAAHDKVRTGPNCASIGLAQDALVGVKHSSTFSRLAQRRIAGVLLADRLSKMTNSR